MPYGPEQWQGEWTWWDMWFCVVCLADADGDWDALDLRLGEPDLEAKRSHLEDLRARLSAAGLSPADLAGDVHRDVKVRSRARTKVLRSHLYPRDLTPAMKDTPSRRMYRLARMRYAASNAVTFLAYAQVAAGAVDRFHVTAYRLDPVMWPARDAMVGAAMSIGDVATARLVLDSAGSYADVLHRHWPSLDLG